MWKMSPFRLLRFSFFLCESRNEKGASASFLPLKHVNSTALALPCPSVDAGPVDARVTWEEARDACIEAGEELVRMDSRAWWALRGSSHIFPSAGTYFIGNRLEDPETR